MQSVRRLAPLAVALLCAACAAEPAPAPEAKSDPLALAVTRLGRAEYALRLGEEAGDDLARARGEVDDALRAAGLAALQPGASLRDAVAEARLALAERDVVVLPPPLTAAGGDPGVALAPVVGRRLGLTRTLAGRVVRYRRVDHDGVLLPDFAAHAALRAGEPAWSPLGRAAGPTVYVDVAAVARRAGRPPFAAVDVATLERTVEGWQAGYLRFALEAAERAVDGQPALVRLHARALLSAMADEQGQLAPLLALARSLAAGAEPGAPPELVEGARFVVDALSGAPGAEAAAAARLLVDTGR